MTRRADPVALTENPPADAERDALLAAAGQPPAERAPGGFRGVAAFWARDRDLLVGQGVVLELRRSAAARRELTATDDPRLAVGLIELLCVRPEYRWDGLEERLMRALLHRFRARVPCRDALIYVGETRAPVLLSTLVDVAPSAVDPLLRPGQSRS
ncbi:hypothetical protein JSE7799_03047 [Jannaschia seosinensis]|uniref:N-acetyltransferase domain-containing protein n=1 Tax=Jannaschia seosinensis TaxID=313367 RepID=A0A0M7BG06_9RHOB|nr:hypothetical protein [Jannaschia seosinensis]CUH40315.1 hypothetical protein JSE7799_03047 [Jannaschia seosinensis]